ncbi:CPBP family intramembrane glutamic endopeptidase [Deinococcus apachensis]|uniref:CPBP family intramembrane glutamic endopeptidase n=1 Tax=Deinococcus apachensis TaxID=309886 RepID=UPI000378CEC1|nr:CPBP family intramembrane glutamic endopeptidase [Deinococcus apachensis]
MLNEQLRRPPLALPGVPVTYVALTLLLAWSFQAAAISSGLDMMHLDEAPPTLWLLLIGMSFSPALAGVATQLLHHRSLRGMGWRIRSWRHLGLGVLAAFGIVTAGQLLALALGATTFDATVATGHAAAFLGGSWAPGWFLVPLYALLASLAYTLPMALFAVGEELGWSGVLIPSLARRFPYPVTCLVYGAVWCSFHLPLVLFAHYGLDMPLWYAVPGTLVSMVLMAFPVAWLRLRSGSVWPGVVFHGMLNAAGFYVYTEVFQPGSSASGVLVRGEGGLAAIAVCVVVASLLVRRSGRGALL